MRTVFLLTLTALGLASTAQGGPYRFYQTGYCYPSYQTYYTPYYQQSYYAQPTYTAPATPTYSKDWKTAVVEYSAALKDIEAFNKAMEAIQPGFATSHVSYGGQGATLYATPAYSYKAAVTQENVGVNLELADQRTARLLNGTQDAFQQGSAQRTEFLAQVSQENARVAEINAKANAVALAQQQTAALFQAANAAPSSKTTTTVSGTGVAQPQVAVNADMQAFVTKVAIPLCGSCHSGNAAKAHVDVTQWANFTPQQKSVVLERLTSDDPTKRMPRLPDGKPGKLTTDQLREFMVH